jgi:PAS domain S-box-containing protein
MTKTSSLRQRLLRQFLLLALLPVAVVSALSVLLLVPALLAHGEQRNLELATAVRDQVRHQLSARQRDTVLINTMIQAGRMDDSSASSALHALVANDPLLSAAYLADARGIVVAVALPPGSGLNEADLIGLDQSGQPHFALAQRSQEPVWSETFLSLLTGRVTAVVVTAGPQRAVVVELALDGLSQSLAEIGRSAQTRVVVLDRAGRVIGHPDASQALRQENLRQWPLVRQAMLGEAGSGRIEVGGTDYLAHAMPVQPVGWSVLVMQPTRLLLGPLYALGWVLAGVLVLALMGASALGWVLARRSGHEVERLALAANAAANTFDAAPDQAFDTTEFRAVWSRLRTLFSELHDRDFQTESARRDLQAVLDAATEVAIIATDTAGTVTTFSNGAQKMLGRRTVDVVGRLTPQAWHDSDEVARRGEQLSRQLGHPVTGFETFVAMARHGGYEVRDWTFLHSDGHRIDVSLAVTAMRNANGELTGFLGVAIDVSERRRAAESEVARRSAEVANQAKSEFLSRMSHELRTPLNAVLGYAQLIDTSQAEPPTAAQHRQLQQIQRSGWHLVQLIDDVLDLARIESGHVRVQMTALTPTDAVARATEITAPLLQQLGVTLVLDDPARQALPMVHADATRLTQVLVNLLSNAAKYNRPGGTVRLQCETVAERGVAFRVSDDGLGMDEQQLAQLFQPFNRLGREDGPIEGTGIGLVLSRRLLEMMGGSIDVQSQAGQGSTFTALLPLHHAAEPAPAPTDAPVAGAPWRAGAGLVLYIEDNAVNAMLMREVMRQRPAIELLQAGNAADGLALARQRRPDLLLLDMHLPDAHGDAVLDQLAADPLLHELPVIVVSADATQAQVDSALGRGVQAYLTKPLNVAELLAAVDAALARAERRSAVPLV